MIGNFIFNDIESDSFKLVCKSVKRPLLPAAKVNRMDLPTMSGVFDFENFEYSLRPITMQIAYIGIDYTELRTRARSIAAWLSTSKWTKLIIKDEPDKYYLAKVTSEIDLTSLWESGTADITFDCQPYAYSVNESVYSFSTTSVNEYTFENPGTRRINAKSPDGSKSIITIVGSWDLLFVALNDSTLQVHNSSGTLVIDNVEMEVTIDGVNKFSLLDGDDIDTFLTINPGVNKLTVTGSKVNVTVTISFIPMWI